MNWRKWLGLTYPTETYMIVGQYDVKAADYRYTLFRKWEREEFDGSPIWKEMQDTLHFDIARMWARWYKTEITYSGKVIK